MRNGIVYSLLASILFAFGAFYVTFLTPLSGTDIYMWRVVFTIPGLFILIILIKRVPVLRSEWKRFNQQPRFYYPRLIASAIIMGVQMWLFLWAPFNGVLIDVSMGYFLLPISLSAVGYFFFKEKFTRFQLVALIFAVSSGLYQLIITGHISIYTLIVCLGYPYYFVLKKELKLSSVTGIFWDHLLVLPICMVYLYFHDNAFQAFTLNPNLYFLIPVLGILTSLAMTVYMVANKRLPIVIFGMLGYVEPAAVFLVAVLLGEAVGYETLPSYLLIWLAISCLIIEGLLKIKKRKDRNIELY